MDCISPGDLHNPEIKPASPALAGKYFTTEPPGKPIIDFEKKIYIYIFNSYLN